MKGHRDLKDTNRDNNEQTTRALSRPAQRLRNPSRDSGFVSERRRVGALPLLPRLLVLEHELPGQGLAHRLPGLLGLALGVAGGRDRGDAPEARLVAQGRRPAVERARASAWAPAEAERERGAAPGPGRRGTRRGGTVGGAARVSVGGDARPLERRLLCGCLAREEAGGEAPDRLHHAGAEAALSQVVEDALPALVAPCGPVLSTIQASAFVLSSNANGIRSPSNGWLGCLGSPLPDLVL